MMGGYGFNMMGGYGSNMLAFGLLGWVINLLVIGLVVYFSASLAIKKYFKDQK